LNLDSENEGELYIGCAGGTNATLEFSYKETPVPEGCIGFNLFVRGLKGGHSGVDIHLQRGNSNKLLFRFIRHAVKRRFQPRLASVEGGSLRNAIPRESSAVIVIPEKKEKNFMKEVLKFAAIYKKELAVTEPELVFGAERVNLPPVLIDKNTQKKLVNTVVACPNGVIRMSDEMKGIVETSNNLAVVRSAEGKITVLCLLRSSVDSSKTELGQVITAIAELAGVQCELSGEYPGWKPNLNSPVLKTMQEIYQNKYGNIPEIKVIHAGLECGLLGGVYPKLDMISFGPTIHFPHSPDEKVNIASVGKFWDYLVETLKNIPVK
jgi:dipeptidase D